MLREELVEKGLMGLPLFVQQVGKVLVATFFLVSEDPVAAVPVLTVLALQIW